MSDRALDLMSALTLEDGRRWGEAAVAWQWSDARAVLDPESATPYHFLTRSRGGAKTSDLAGMAIAAMLAQLAPRSRLYGLAADRDQGRLLVDSIASYEARTPELRGAIRVDAYRVTASRSGSVLEVIAADAPSAWGLCPDFLIADELAQWAQTPGPRRLWEAASSAIAKRPYARLVTLTTAGDPAHWSAKVLDHAKRDPLWRVHEVRGPAPWLDPVRLAEQRRRLPASVYARLFENVWTASEDRLVSPEDLAACVTLDGPLEPQPGIGYVIGVDLGLRRDRTACAICHAEPVDAVAEGQVRAETVGMRVVLDRLAVWAGTREQPVLLRQVEEWLAQAARRYRARVLCDPWQAAGLVERLRARGVDVAEFPFTAQSVGRLAAALHVQLRERGLDLPDDPELLDELANLRLRETSPGVVRVDHDADRHDDRAIALGIAVVTLVSERPRTLMMPSFGRVGPSLLSELAPGTTELSDVFLQPGQSF